MTQPIPRKDKLSFLAREIEMLRSALDLVDAYVFTKDTEGRYTFANAKVCQLFGRPLAQIVGLDDSAFFDFKVQNELRQNDQLVMGKGETIAREETNVILATGETRIYWSVKAPLRDERGIIVGMSGISTDITERKQLEKSVLQGEERFKSLFDSSPDPVWIIEGNRFVECNQAAVDFLGYPDKIALENTHPSELSPVTQPDGESSFSKAERMMSIVRAKGINRFEWVHQRADGSPFWAEVTLSPIRLDGRDVIYCVWRDITDRKWQDERIQVLLKEQRMIFENAHVGILHLQQRRIIKCNRSAAEMLGYGSPEEIEGRTTEFLYKSHEYFIEAGKQGYGQLKSQGYAVVETEVVRKNGEMIWIIQAGRTLDQENVLDAPSIWVYTDITEQKKLEGALRQSRQFFSQAFESCPVPASIARVADGRFIEANVNYERDFGWKREAIIGKTSLEINLWPDAVTRRNWIDALRDNGGRLVNYETRWHHQNGNLRDVSLSSEIVRIDSQECVLAYVTDITERKRQEARIHALLDEQRFIFENAQVGILMLRNRRILKCNQHIADMLGYDSPEELIGHTTRIFYDSDAVYEAVGKLGYAQLAETGFSHFESRLCDRNGNPVWAWLSGRTLDTSAVLDAPSIWVYTDITERKLADLALRQSQQKFSTAFESCPLAASITEVVTGRFVEVNSSYERNFGWMKEDMVGHTSVELGFWADVNDRSRWLDSVLKEGRQIDFQTAWRHKNGSHCFVSLSTEMIELDGKSCLLTYVTDITARKQTEDDLRIAAAAFDSQEGMVVTDARSVILRVNRAFTELTGYSAEEVVGKTPNFFKSDRHDADFYRDMWNSILRTGSWQGEIWDRRKNGEVYPKWLTISAVKNVAGEVTHYIGTQFDITERKRAEEKIQALAFYDQLTGLANRASLNEQLAHTVRLADRNGSQFALMLLDLDNFKSVNDSLGHHVGDALLVHVGERLQASVRQSDLVARFGGDEFVILLPEIESPEDAAHVADKIINALEDPCKVGTHELRTSPSIGICLYPNDASDSLDLLQKADAAMYHAKALGRNQYQFFKAEYQEAAQKRLTLEADLRRAISLHQFQLHYQPQLDLRTGRIVGVEALIRWRHPQRGMVMPLEFIPAAEETGLILPIGDWVLGEACRQLAAWQASGIPDLSVSVNLTASQFLDEALPARIEALLEQHGVSPHSLMLEVTESMSMTAPEQTIASMRALDALGLSLSIDDFGTGYSSLSYLKLFPVGALKIDRSFVKDIETDQNDADICDVTVLLAHKLGLEVVAEGVETEAQLKYLLSIGCEKVQGYLISRPLSAEATERFIAGNPRISGLGTVDLWAEPAPD